ncbi:MAG: hypothetical protein Fur0018_17940 [Anaerolineales bacterium]
MPEDQNPEAVNPEEDARERFRRLLQDAKSVGNELDAGLPTLPMDSAEPPADSFDSTDTLNAGQPTLEMPAVESASPPADDLPVIPGLTADVEALKDTTRPGVSHPAAEAGADTLPAQAADALADTPPAALSDTRPRKAVTPPSRPLVPPTHAADTPLPRRVSQDDAGATRVSRAAYQAHPSRPVSRPPSRPISRPPTPPPPATPSAAWRRNLGCLLRFTIIGLFVGVVLALLGLSIGLYQYYQIASTLPDVSTLHQRAAKFETTRILDRNGNVLYEVIDPSAGRRTYVSLDQISPYLVAATIATEDKGFYSHPGFDPLALVRALWQNYTSGEVVSGASTITQQLARILLLGPDERFERSYRRKAREIILAAEITRRYSKDEILELYLNEIYYGNLSYGIEAASETYFGVGAGQLTLFQAAFLAGLPQAPSVYDVYTNRDVTLGRSEQVLVLMFQDSQEQGCIYVSNNQQPVCVDAVAAAQALQELKAYNFHNPDVQIRYPHWVNYVRGLLESQFDPQTIYRSGFTVYTTLDPGLQDAAQEIVAQQIASLAANHATNGALVAIRPATGEILAMVGSADFNNPDIDGQVNMALAPRQPGSSIKPFTYLAAFEKGWTPATVIWDVPSEFPPSGDPADPRPPYKPVNYDGKFRGPVTVRTALANSLNVPAVKALQFVGIYDDATLPGDQGLVAMMQRLGIATLTRDDYGLALTLGGGDVTLLEHTAAFAVLANGGRRVPPVAITRIEDHNGNVIFEYQPPSGDQVLRAEHVFLISDILSDNEARAMEFGRNSVLHLPFQAAAKTGTTNDFRDNWTMGYTPDIAVGVWVGNADYTPMQNSTGLSGAAPIWAEFMQIAVQQLTGGNSTPFVKPAGVIEDTVCALSGTKPSKWCPEQRREYFAADQPPLPESYDLWQKVLIDTWTELRAGPQCSDFTVDKFALNVTDPDARQWIKKTDEGRAWAEAMGFRKKDLFFVPQEQCNAESPHPKLAISAPGDGAVITASPVDIYAQVDASTNFKEYRLEYGLGNNPEKWELLNRSTASVPRPDKIYTWDVGTLPAGPVTLRIYMESTTGTYAEVRLHLDLQVPTPTPTPSPTPTASPTPTPTPTASPTVPPSPTAPPSPTPVPPTAAPSFTPTLLPTKTPVLITITVQP